jgi:hypothetical protein
MNKLYGPLTPSALALVSLASLFLAGTAGAQVTCAMNPATGRMEAALAWKNTLGVERANAICQSARLPETVAYPSTAASAPAPQVPAPAAPAPRQDAVPAQPAVAVAPVPAPAPVSASPAPAPVSVAPQPATRGVTFTTPPPQAPMQPIVQAPLEPVGTQAMQAAAPTAAPAQTFTATPRDRTFREVLVKWASQAGWAFSPEHWGIGRDIPVSGDVQLGTDFKTAVRTLLKSSTMSDTPVRPCFYSNNVLRVIPANELCQRTDL